MGVAVYADDLSLKTQRVGQSDVVEDVKAISSAVVAGLVKNGTTIKFKEVCMKRFSLVEFSVDHPRLIVALSIILTLIFMTQFPKVRTDTNPKNMLPPTSAVRVGNDEVEKTFGLYEDMIVLGIQNDKGILNPDTLGKIQRITGPGILPDSLT